MRPFASIQKPLLLAAALSAPAAAAADVTATAIHAPEERYSFELDPLPMLLLLSPGSGGIAGEFEARMSRHFSVFADAYHMQVHLSDKTVNQMQKDQDQPDGIPSDMVASGIATGVRYYGDAFADSWYLGAKFGGGTEHTDWSYDDQRLQDDSFSYTLSAEAGYRWLWASGLLLRIGGGLGMNDVTQRTVSAMTAATGTAADAALANVESKSPSNRPTLAISYDLGLGWTF